jgi:hypothetical protein
MSICSAGRLVGSLLVGSAGRTMNELLAIVRDVVASPGSAGLRSYTGNGDRLADERRRGIDVNRDHLAGGAYGIDESCLLPVFLRQEAKALDGGGRVEKQYLFG